MNERNCPTKCLHDKLVLLKQQSTALSLVSFFSFLECLLVLVLLRSVLQLVKNAILSAQSPRSQHVQYFVMLKTNLNDEGLISISNR